MADVFISYNQADRKTARLLEAGIASRGWTVWWDREIQVGQNFRPVIDQALDSARSVLVIWSGSSVGSDWVCAEAEEGRKRGLLFPVRLDDAKIPLVFRELQAADFRNWDGNYQYPEFKSLLATLARHLGGVPELPVSEAIRSIKKFCAQRRATIREVVLPQNQTTTTNFVFARADDGAGCVYCHLAGSYIGQTFYVRKGISYYYHVHIGGPASQLGLPVSNEELVDPHGFPTTYFEHGYIEWSHETGVARAAIFTPGGEQEIGTPLKL